MNHKTNPENTKWQSGFFGPLTLGKSKFGGCLQTNLWIIYRNPKEENLASLFESSDRKHCTSKFGTCSNDHEHWELSWYTALMECPPVDRQTVENTGLMEI